MTNPVPPDDDLGEKFNTVTRFFTDACDAPFLVYAEAFRDALVPTLMEYFAIDIQQIAISMVRPSKAFYTYRGRRKGEKGWKANDHRLRGTFFKAAEFDLNNYLAKHMFGARDVTARAIPMGAATMWIIEGTIARVLFWLFIVDLVFNFLYRWATLVQKSEYCQAQAATILVADGPAQGTIPPAGWVTTNLSNVRKQRGPVYWLFGQGEIFAGHANMVFSSQMVQQPPLNLVARGGLRILGFGPGGQSSNDTKEYIFFGDQPQDVTLNVAMQLGWTYQCQDRSTEGFILLANPTCVIVGGVD